MGPFFQYYLSLITWLVGLAALAVLVIGGPRAVVFLLAGITALALVFNLFSLSCPVCGNRVGPYFEGLRPRLPGRNCRRCHHDLRRRGAD